VKRTTVPLMYNLDERVEGLDVVDFPGVDDRDETISDLADLLLTLSQIVIFVVDYRYVAIINKKVKKNYPKNKRDLGMACHASPLNKQRNYGKCHYPATVLSRKKWTPPKWFPPVQILRSIWTPRSVYFRIVLKYLVIHKEPGDVMPSSCLVKRCLGLHLS